MPWMQLLFQEETSRVFAIGCDCPELSGTVITWHFHEKYERVFEVDGWLGDLGKGGILTEQQGWNAHLWSKAAGACPCGTEGEQLTRGESVWTGLRSACSLHHEGVGSSVIVADSGKELKFMACQRSELGREVKRQQNILDVLASKENITKCVSWTQCLPWSWFVLVGCYMLAVWKEQCLKSYLGLSRAACAAFEARELPKVQAWAARC